MTYDVEVPKERYNTEITREYFKKYRADADKRSLFSHWSIVKGKDSDILLKTGVGAVNGSFAALIACVHSNVVHTKGHFTLVGVAANCYKHGTPWIVAGTTYGVTVSMLSQLRHKESPVHHMVAGYAAGTMLGTWYKWPMMGVWSGGILAAVGGFLKYWHDNDMLDDMPLRRQRLFNMYRLGWFTERPDAEGSDDAHLDSSFKFLRS